MAWGTLTIGALVLKETDILTDATNANTGERSVKLEGAETVSSGATVADLEAKLEDILGLINRAFPVTFSRKSSYNGYYMVDDTNAEFEKWVQGPAQIRWSLSMTFIGPGNQVEFESRLASVVRANDFALAGERWHAPAIGHYGYYVGTTSPAAVTRTGADGAMTVYRALPAGLSPRWGCTPTNYPGGRVRILQASLERAGISPTLTPTGWEVNNGLVRVKADTIAPTSTLRVGVWSAGAWHDKGWDVIIAGTTVDDSNFQAAVVLRNDPEMCTVRVIAQPAVGVGRYLIDCTIRRGSRFVECYVQRPSSGGIDVRLDVAEGQTDFLATGYTMATANDADGNRFVIGSSKTVTAVTGGISRAATLAMDFYVGCEIGGTAAVAGDTAVNMRDQYIGALAEKVGVTRR
jgi:hypothetical protein